MLWAVWSVDSDTAAEIRSQYSKQHSAHLNGSPIRLVIAGPLRADDGVAAVGSLLIFEAESRSDVENMVAADPFNRQGVWRSVEIRAFNMSRNNSLAESQ